MTSTTAPALPDTPAELLRAVRDLKKTTDRADIEMMRLAVHWADLHLADPEFAEACFTSPKTFAGEGSPAIDEFCVPEFATMLGRTNDSAGRFLTDCVELAYRLPQLWAAVQQGLVAGWRARLIAESTLALSLDAAAYVDAQVFFVARLPRVLASALVGSAFAIAGVVFQAFLRNPLASPDTLGVSSGATLGAGRAGSTREQPPVELIRRVDGPTRLLRRPQGPRTELPGSGGFGDRP